MPLTSFQTYKQQKRKPATLQSFKAFRQERQGASFSGTKSRTLAVRNNNPGNLRFIGQPGARPGEKNFARFSTPQAGFEALKRDLEAKVTGRTVTGLKPTSTLLDFASKYAPAGDGNNPVQYARNVASRLGVNINTRIGSLSSKLDDFAIAVAYAEDSNFNPSMVKRSSTSKVQPSKPRIESVERETPFETTKKGITLNTLLGIPKALKETFLPTRGFSEKELKIAKPTIKEKLLATPKAVAEFSSIIGDLLASSDKSLAAKFSQTKVGGKLADVGAKITEFGKPKTAGQAQAMRVVDALSLVPIGSLKISATGAQAIARTKNLKTIVSVLKKEIPKLTDEAAESFGRVFVNIDNADEVRTSLNKIDYHLSKAKQSSKALPERAYTPERTPAITEITPKVSPKIAPTTVRSTTQVGNRIPKELEPLAQEAKKYKSGQEFADDFLSGRFIPPKTKVDEAVESLIKERDVLVNKFYKTGGVRKGAEFEEINKRLLEIEKELEEKFPYTNKMIIGRILDSGELNREKNIAKLTDFYNKVTKAEIVPLNQAISKFEKTGTADVVIGKDYGISIKDEGDFISVRFGSNDLTPIGSVPSGERNFATKEEAFDFAKQIQEKLQVSKGQLTERGSVTTLQTTPGISDRVASTGKQSPLPERLAKFPEPLPGRGKVLPRELKSQTTSSRQSLSEDLTSVKGQAQRLSDEIYESNRATVKPGKMQRAKDGLKASLGTLREGADKILGTISTRLKNIDPSLKRAIRDFEFKLASNTQKDRRAIAPFLKKIRAKDMDAFDYADLDLALKNGDFLKTKEIISKYGLEDQFAVVRKTLDDLYKRAEDVGYDIGYEKNYFPRMVEDSSGLLEFFEKGDDWSIIDEAIRAKEIDLGRYLTVNEKANVINTLVRGFPTGKITLSKTGAMKARRIDVINAELNQFYRDSVESLLRYVDETNDAIEARRFFGKGKKTDQFAHIEDSVGSYILNLLSEGKIKPSQERELREILLARFSPRGTSGVTRVYKNLSYIDTMGSFTSAITQLGDLAFAIYKGGPINAAKSFGKAVIGKSEITRADIGIEKIAQEFADASRSANAVSRVFKLIGLEKFDALGKETVINASISKFRSLADNPTTKFMQKIEAIFGDNPAVVSQVIEDLRTGRITENVKLLAFNELLDVQPVALSEMPEQYLKGGNGRIFYMLKTYTIKLFDVYRNEVFSQLRTNPVQGLKNLLYLTGSLLVMNATADEIKDLLLNRETSLKDRTVDNILKLAGFSKFTIYKAREEGIGSAVAKTILPPFKLIDSLYKDITQTNALSDLESIQSIPIGGKLYYWWFGKGAKKSEKKREAKAESDDGFGELDLGDELDLELDLGDELDLELDL